jgi:DNA-binding MarR family transcriptional regulator
MKAKHSLEVLGLFRMIFRSSSKHSEDIEKTVGVSGTQLWALAEMKEVPNITVNNLAKTMALHQSTISNLIDKMERKNLIQRVRSTEDKRVVYLSLTTAGEEMLQKAPSPVKGILVDALARMSEEDLTQLQTNLTKLISSLGTSVSAQSAKEPLGASINIEK